MSVILKCAACGAEVEFEELSPTIEKTCPGCEVQVRYRKGDEQMAIPVSMNLPEEFTHVDLSAVADKSSLLVGRYKKPALAPSAGASTEVILAKALETLAHSIGHLEERLSKHEQGGAAVTGERAEENPSVEPAAGNGNGHSNGVVAVAKNGSEEEGGEVVQLEPEEQHEEEKFRGKSKADPVGARVLVRREAAKEAHEFRREKHTQADWDEMARPDDRRSGFAWLMESYPKTTVLVSLLFVAGLITTTILWMDDLFTTQSETPEPNFPGIQGTELGKMMADDPEAALAETVARAYLNATSAKAAQPFVWESERIVEKFEKYYRPIPSPGSYDLILKQRALGPDGKPQFLFRVSSVGEKARMMLVLPEGVMPKVFWEHFAEIGDVSWDDFFKAKPQQSVEMRVWVHPVEKYIDGYGKDDWQSYMLHDYAESRKILAYAKRGLGQDWKIADALKNDPVNFNRHDAVMSLLELIYMTEFKFEEESGAVVEIKDVIATSWLPARFGDEPSK